MRLYRFTINDKQYEVIIKSADAKEAVIELNGRPITVNINAISELSPLNFSLPTISSPPKKISKRPPPPPPAGPLMAQIPGKVTAIFVKEGDHINIGDKILILEVMKMENVIVAHRDGIISKIYMQVGDTAFTNHPLILIE
ncbi:MAG: hypothetical protein A2504_15115 [Bdellovibrionales bacterium RIFOXYD12_FULL_39_22]|nr:MAG: hypothetical protein A2385_02545 [Bdellovibrionales bacterium RIFOXYB1_FULL_39_21]OFZ43126.1 MAG: hypothetical protein A2485_11690 [Bdellovibrionales bacterium RIFOXYC12_FULL_39_17]OFZ47864.1 MAG: hypothetical protein A2404_16330 [Bdellovibrionales bacterium RIFOXYC1_FULL_39_130]OFZ75644.1 MAG: hypothetical protein A2560_12830 [Bdellovibrionales bacterium RIFOXYD1_FULL_39_84]OFZ94134.1 MAG: hypothetical protein A2504_15115 [Bdellovibrionales bacterium RIFOXYD12_FULL_39_22]HLE11801.1 bi